MSMNLPSGSLPFPPGGMPSFPPLPYRGREQEGSPWGNASKHTGGGLPLHHLEGALGMNAAHIITSLGSSVLAYVVGFQVAWHITRRSSS